jgi:uncharacterized sulfatase
VSGGFMLESSALDFHRRRLRAVASRRTAILAVLPLLLLTPDCGPGEAVPRPPNVVMIISDDHAWSDFGFMEHPVVETPSLDRLASQGLLYTRGYTPSSLCRPSLATLITGLYPHEHGIFSNDPPKPPGSTFESRNRDPAYRHLRELMTAHIDRVNTLPRLLAEKEYVSFQSGKWWEGSYQRGGFTAGMTHGDPERGGRNGDAGLAIGRQTLQPIFDFITEAGDRPFFLWFAPLLPHLPHDPPPELLEKYLGEAPSIRVARYWATIEWLDATTDRLLAFLDERGLTDQTLVIFAADNGWIQQPDKVRHTRRSKGSPFEGGVRTPIILRWPNRIEPGRDDTPVTLIDIVPTVLAAGGIVRSPSLPGVDLLDREAVGGREAIFGECFGHNAVDIDDPASSLRYRWSITGRWKLIVPHTGRSEPIMLYDLLFDPWETDNVAAQNPAVIQRLLSDLDAWWRPATS